MTGTIIYEPPMPTACERNQCGGKPPAAKYRDGTIWECDECGAQWIVWSGAQYNESFSAWKLHRPAPKPTEPVCTCPSGDGSLRWPCPAHPPTGSGDPS